MNELFKFIKKIWNPIGNLSRYRFRRIILQLFKYIILIILLLVIVIPIYWVFSTSLKPASEIQAWPPQWIPQPITLESYRYAFRLLPIGRFFLNSLIVTSVVIVSNIVTCSIAGYTLARKRFLGRNFIFGLILSSMMVPLHVRVIPMYLMSLKLGLENTYPGIFLPIASTGFGIFMMRQFFITLPGEVMDAARIDGCGEWGIVFRIVMPMSKGAVSSLALFALVWSFEDFLWPLIITSSTNMRPLQVGITLFLGLVVYEWGPVMATTALTITPMIIIYILLQRRFIEGITAGAVKG